MGSIPLGHDPHPPLLCTLCIFLRADGDFGPDFRFSGLEGDLEVKLVVDGCLLGGPGVADDIAQVTEGGDEGTDFIFGDSVLSVGANRLRPHERLGRPGSSAMGDGGGRIGASWLICRLSMTSRRRSLRMTPVA
jgi:hypothetical protein